MKGRRGGGRSDKTRNLKHARLTVTWPGRKPWSFEVRSAKELRAAIRKYLAAGATVVEQVHTGYGSYRTTRTHTPTQHKEPAA